MVFYLCAQLAVRTVHLQLFTYIDKILVRPESIYNKQICSTLSV